MKNSKLKNCKVCGAEVAKSAKSCPQCGAKLKNGHPILIGIIVFFVLVIIGSSGDDDKPKKIETTTPTQNVETTPVQTEQKTEPEKENKSAFYVGETAELKGVSVTLASVTESTGSTYNTPTDGNIFVLCEFEISNNSDIVKKQTRLHRILEILWSLVCFLYFPSNRRRLWRISLYQHKR